MQELQVFFFRHYGRKTSLVWWDTGSIVTGTGLGYRQLFNTNNLFGVYGSFDLMYDFSVRFAGGLERANRNHALTVNFYVHTFPQAEPKICDVGGINAIYSYKQFQKLSLFLGYALSWQSSMVTCDNNIDVFYPAPKKSVGILFGGNVILNAHMRFELKVLKGSISIGLHITDSPIYRKNYIKDVRLHMMTQPPRRYLPSHSSILVDEEVLFGLTLYPIFSELPLIRDYV